MACLFIFSIHLEAAMLISLIIGHNAVSFHKHVKITDLQTIKTRVIRSITENQTDNVFVELQEYEDKRTQAEI